MYPRRGAARHMWTVNLALVLLTVVTLVCFLPGARGARAQPGDPAEVQLAFVGDVMLASRVGDLVAQEGVDYPWRHVAPVLQAADLAVANLECAVGTTGKPQQGKEWTFRAAPAALQGLVRAGIDVVGVANNHALDYGRDCFLETLENLEKAGIVCVGGGRNLEEASRPYIAERKGIKVGILGVCLHLPAGWNATPDRAGLFSGFDSARLLEAIRDLDSRVDWTVVFVHWGKERTDYPEKWQRTTAESMLRAGADLVVGHHPHVWQGIDRRENSVVAYSLGNFVFTIRPEFPQQQETGILLVTLTRDSIREVRVLPARIPRAGETVLLEGDAALGVLARIDRLSAPFYTYVTEEGVVRRAAFADIRDHWARESIGALAARGLVQGDGTGRYRPQEPATCAGFLAMLGRALALPDSPQVPLAAGVGQHWAAPYLRAALATGMWSADDMGSFALDAPVPRWKVACTLAAALGVAGQPLPLPVTPPGYADLTQAPGTSLDGIARVTAAGIMRGYPDGRFGPHDPLSRAEIACVLARVIAMLGAPGDIPQAGSQAGSQAGHPPAAAGEAVSP